MQVSVYLDPGQTAPAQVVAGPVKCNVQRVEVARLPVEEPFTRNIEFVFLNGQIQVFENNRQC